MAAVKNRMTNSVDPNEMACHELSKMDLCLERYLFSSAGCQGQHLACWVKFLAENILTYFSFFFSKIIFGISCELSPKETVHMISGIINKI